jgi:Prp8 binding protein
VLLQAEILSCRFDPTGQNIAACSADRGICASRPSRSYFLITLSLTNTIFQRYGERIPQIRTMGSFPQYTKRLYWTSNGPYFHPFFTVFQPITLLHILIYPPASAYANSAPTARSSTRLTGLSQVAQASNSLPLQVMMALCACGKGEMTRGRNRWRYLNLAVRSLPWPGVRMARRSMLALSITSSMCESCCIPRCGTHVIIQVLDLRKQEEVSVLSGHVDTPTGLAISPNGSYLLSPSFSSQSIIHDIRPFAPSPNRVHRVLGGAPAGFENTLLRGAWSREDGGRRVAVGGADRTVTIWDVESSKILYKVCSVIFLDSTRHNTGFVAVVAWAQGYRHSGGFPSPRTDQ